MREDQANEIISLLKWILFILASMSIANALPSISKIMGF